MSQWLNESMAQFFLRRPGFAQGIRNLARRHRDDIVVAVQSYARWSGTLLRASFETALWRLGLDHADVLIVGWYNHRPAQAILDAAQANTRTIHDLLIKLAATPAPKPLSMFTTRTPAAQEFNIANSAARPPKLAP